MTMYQLPLRVLYTVNSSPQYILARSPSSVQVTLCPSPSVANAQYALAPLKACLNAICNSSPELLLDNSRDFSIYVLDPLESQTMPAPVNFSQSNVAPVSMPQAVQPRGVAVALGLMSWALTADESDSVTVTGTITTLGTGLDALEVVFALRETKHIQKSHLSDALKSWSQPPKTSQPNKLIAPAKPTISETPPSSQEPVKPLTRSADFPEVYIGPPRRARGRPEGPNKKAKRTKSRKPPVRPAAPPFICAPLVRPQQQQPAASPAPATAPLLTLLSALSGGRDNTALLAALSTVDSTPPGSEPSPALLNALRDLLAAQSQTQQPSHALQPVSRNSQDDDIVILEKEHIDPTAFRRRIEREDSSKSAPTTADESEMTPQRQRRARIPSGGKENTYSSPVTRKRRLSDFMAEQEKDEARRRRTHSRSESGRTEVPQPAVPPGYLRSVRLDFDPSLPSVTATSSSLFRPRSFPSKSMFRSASQSQASFAIPPQAQEPVKPVKNFVVPEWARTSTATQPKLSKEVEERIALVEQEKKQKRAARRMQKPGSWQQGVRTTTELFSEEGNISSAMVHEPIKETTMPRPQSALSLSLPVFASDTISSPLSPSSPVSETPPMPSTPPRKTSVLRATPRSLEPDGTSPLFSPTPKSLWGSTRKTPLFSPQPRTPSRKGKKPVFSPIYFRTPSTTTSPLLLGLKSRSSLEWTNKSVEQPVDREEEDLLDKELDEALQGMEVPEVKQQDTADGPEADDSTVLPPSPLPPSSPLPPTSPFLLPSTDDVMEEFMDSDAFFSDSDGALGDASELPPSSMSDWFSSDDDGGGDMDGMLILDESSGLELADAFAPNAFADMDFTEFWESLKPLLQASENGEGDTTVSMESGASVEGVDVDHAKLAQEVQVLFSGCLM